MEIIRTLRQELDRMADQLQILEMQKGWHYMLGSQLNQRYEELQTEYETLIRHSRTTGSG